MTSRSVVSASTVKRGPSPSLYFCSAAAPWPLTARIQPFCEHSTVTGSRPTSAAGGVSTPARGAPADPACRRAAPLARRPPLPLVAGDQRVEPGRLGGEPLQLLLDRD